MQTAIPKSKMPNNIQLHRHRILLTDWHFWLLCYLFFPPVSYFCRNSLTDWHFWMVSLFTPELQSPRMIYLLSSPSNDKLRSIWLDRIPCQLRMFPSNYKSKQLLKCTRWQVLFKNTYTCTCTVNWTNWIVCYLYADPQLSVKKHWSIGRSVIYHPVKNIPGVYTCIYI